MPAVRPDLCAAAARGEERQQPPRPGGAADAGADARALAGPVIPITRRPMRAAAPTARHPALHAARHAAARRRCRRCRSTCTCPGACEVPVLRLQFARSCATRRSLPEQRYLDALMADLEAALPLVWGRTVHSIFIGGGTPSLFSPAGHRPPARRHPRAAASWRPTARSRWRPTPAPSRETASGPFAAPASRGCRSACRASTTSTCRRWAACTTARQAHRRGRRGGAGLRHLQPRPDVCAARPDAGAARAGHGAGAGAGAAAPLDLPPDDRAQHLLRQVPAARSPKTTRPTPCSTASPR